MNSIKLGDFLAKNLVVKKNDIIQLQIDALSSEGGGIGSLDGLRIFVANTIPGDTAECVVIKTKKNYAVAKLRRVLTPSNWRIQPLCPVSERCGGCAFQAMDYEKEVEYKLNKVSSALEKIAHLQLDVSRVLAAPATQHYRNKAQYPVKIENGEFVAGFYARRSHRVVNAAACILQPLEFEKGIAAVAKWAKQLAVTSYDEETHTGLLRHVYLRKAFGTGEIMACVVINDTALPGESVLVQHLREELPGVKSIVVNYNTRQTNVVLGDKNKTLWGSSYITDELLGNHFRISPNSFYQVNHAQTQALYSTVRDFAGLTGEENVLDLYCGAGTIGITLADSAKTVTGVEIVPSAIENAKQNASLNGVNNAEFYCMDAEEYAKMAAENGTKIDVLVLDPPRKGCSGETIAAVCKIQPQKIVYVSCDPATLARDLALLAQNSYSPVRLAVADLFPRTPHVECVVLMTKSLDYGESKYRRTGIS